VLDPTALYDAVATMDTVTLVRSVIRGLLGACDRVLEDRLRGLLGRDDDYASAGKPVCDYDDPAAREALCDLVDEQRRRGGAVTDVTVVAVRTVAPKPMVTDVSSRVLGRGRRRRLSARGE
jgi:hypothetical protein